MATITGFNVTINTMCDLDKRDCYLAYTYNVLWDENESPNNEDFNVQALLWGGGGFDHNQIFADLSHDEHQVNRGTSFPITRKIPVRCEMLDKFWGESIIIKLVLTTESNEHVRYEALASTEMEQEMAAASMQSEEKAVAA